MPPRSRRTLSAALATFTAVFLVAGLLWLLPGPRYTHTRLAFFAVIAAAGLVGSLGVIVDRPAIAGAGIAGLFLLGFWQAVLWMVIYPAIAALVFAVAIEPNDATESAPT